MKSYGRKTNTSERRASVLSGYRWSPVVVIIMSKRKRTPMGALGQLVCLDGETGKPIWSRDIVEENAAQLPQWGKSGSPLIHDGAVIVSAGGPDGKSLVAYDKV